MDSTRNTTDMLTHQQMREAYEAYAHGTDVGRLAARLEVYPADLQAKFDEMTAERERMRQKPQGGTLGHLNDKLFEQLDRLGEVDASDADALKAEVERSRAVEGIAKTIIENAATVISATRIRAEYTKATVEVPRLLEG